MKGILFTEDLFNKTITGQKTETRRFGSLSKLPGGNFLIGRILGKAYANKNGKVFDNERNEYKPRYKKGDTVYLKEPWLPHPNDSAKTLYKFDYKPDDQIGVFEK